MADCFLFFRCWPGFSEPFPFDRFDGFAKDDELLQALNSWAREEIRRPEARRAIMLVARWRKQEWLAEIQKRRGTYAGRPGRPRSSTSRRSAPRHVTSRDVYWPRIRQPDRPEPLICRFGADLGWWREKGCFGANIPLWRERGDNSLPFGPRVWFYQVPSSELAETVVSALNGRNDLDFDDNKEEYYLRPRFGFVEDTNVALRISALRCIESIKRRKIPEVRSGEMALAMGQKAMAFADEMFAAAGPLAPGTAQSEGEAEKPPARKTAQARKAKRDKPPPPPDDPLCERAQLVLQTLLTLDAGNSDSRVTTAEVVKTSGGIGAVPYKAVIADLRERGYLQTKEGRGGGVWLTDKGKERSEKL